MTNSTSHSESEVGGIAVATVVFLVGMVLLGSLIYGWSKPIERPETKSFASRVLDRQAGQSGAALGVASSTVNSAGDAEMSGASDAEPAAEAANEEESWD